MKMKGIVFSVLMGLVSFSAVSKESGHYLPYFDVDTITDLSDQVRLYNEENGYWDHVPILNPELRRYLDKMNIISKDSEVNGFWM